MVLEFLNACNCCLEKKEPPIEETTPLVSDEVKEEAAVVEIKEEPPKPTGFWALYKADYAKTWQVLYGSAPCTPTGSCTFLWRVILLFATVSLLSWSIIEWVHYGIDDDGSGSFEGFGQEKYLRQNLWKDGIEAKYWFTKFTHWNLMGQSLYFLLLVFTTFRSTRSVREGTPWFVRLTRWLQAMMLTASIGVCIIFWYFLYDHNMHHITIAVHGGQAIIMAVDLLTSRQPLYLVHILWPMIFGGSYALYSYCYFKQGGTFEDGYQPYIYKPLDWREPDKTGILMAKVICGYAPAIYLGIFVFDMFSRKCRTRVGLK